MNKHIELFCKQNPKFYLTCDNPSCKKKHTFNSKDVFKTKLFKFKCDSCEVVNSFDTEKFAKDYESELKKIGVIVK